MDNSKVADLVRRIISGDLSAEGEFVDHYSRGTFYMIKSEVRDHSTAEDISQETFKVVLENIRRGYLREPERVSGYIRTVVQRGISKHFRKQASDSGVEVPDWDHLPSPARSQFDELNAKEESEVIREVIESLRIERDREVLFRFYFDEEDKDKICRELDLTASQFDLVLYRARERFKELYLKRLAERDNGKRQ